jgi:protein-disulfide isomerase
VLAAALIAANQVGAGDRRSTASPRAAARSLFAGIEQHDAVLGSPRAPVTLVECADLQCPYCAAWARDALPAVVSEYVRTGRVRIVFRGLAFLGPDSELALRTVIAAGARDKLWNLLEELYRRQGSENSGWVGDELAAASAAAGVNAHALDRGAWNRATDRALERDARAARAVGVQGTPAFELGRTRGRLALLPLGSLGADGMRQALDAALRG